MTKRRMSKVAILLHKVGEEALEVYNTLQITFRDPENLTMAEIIIALREYCTPKKIFVFERYQFWTHGMSESV